MSKPVVLIIGCSSIVGKATVKCLSRKHSDQVAIKAGTSDPAKLNDCARLGGVEVVEVNMLKEDLADQIKSTGAEIVYSITPGDENRADIARKTFDACKQAGVKHLVTVSVLTADLRETIFGRQFSAIENYLKQLGVPYTILRLPVLMENNRAYTKTIRSDSAVHSPINPHAFYTPIAVSDVGKVSAAILAKPQLHVNKTVTVAAMPHNHYELVHALTELLGRQIQVVRTSYSAAREAFVHDGYPEWQVDGVLELFKMIDDASSVTCDTEGMVQFKAITGSDPRTIYNWVHAMYDKFH